MVSIVFLIILFTEVLRNISKDINRKKIEKYSREHINNILEDVLLGIENKK
jgi:hypothetical protein